MSRCNCCFLTCIQISQEAGKVVWYSHLFKNYPQFAVIYTVKSFGIVNKAVVFLVFPWFFDYPTDVSDSISGFSASSKSSFNIWKFMVLVLLKSFLENFEHWLSGKESTCSRRRCRFDPWVGKIPGRRKWQPTPVFLPGKSHGRGVWRATVQGDCRVGYDWVNYSNRFENERTEKETI